jgi:DNA repair protein RecN (Recombination protein N)
MLIEVVVRDLGVIEHVSVLPGSHMTALTGETGAGKTLIVEALSLLLGGRAEAMMIRPGAEEARVDGRFELDGHERVLTRVVARGGRSRAYVDGHPVTVAQLAELGAGLVDVHGQHAHQSLLSAAAQRDALDAFGNVDRSSVIAARNTLHEIDRHLSALGGDERTRMRELDLLRFQLAELDAASLDDVDEDAKLSSEESLLAHALAHQQAGTAALESLRAEGGVRDLLGVAASALIRRQPFSAVEERVAGLIADTDDVIGELRSLVDSIEDDPQRQAQVRERRQLLRELQRKYGESIEAIIGYREEVRVRIDDLASHEQRAAELEHQRVAALDALKTAAAEVKAARLNVAHPLAIAVQRRLVGLAMPKATLAVNIEASNDTYGVDEGADVRFLLAANPGSPLLPLAKVASGGELARSMLALRLALLESRVALGGIPDTLVFDEVDAGIGGAAAVAVGEALAELGAGRQVIVVTHLAQVAAKADRHITVAKVQAQNRTDTTVKEVGADERVGEIARMLGGNADSEAGRRHAEELLGSGVQRKSGASVKAVTQAKRTSRAKPARKSQETPLVTSSTAPTPQKPGKVKARG